MPLPPRPGPPSPKEGGLGTSPVERSGRTFSEMFSTLFWQLGGSSAARVLPARNKRPAWPQPAALRQPRLPAPAHPCPSRALPLPGTRAHGREAACPLPWPPCRPKHTSRRVGLCSIPREDSGARRAQVYCVDARGSRGETEAQRDEARARASERVAGLSPLTGWASGAGPRRPEPHFPHREADHLNTGLLAPEPGRGRHPPRAAAACATAVSASLACSHLAHQPPVPCQSRSPPPSSSVT